MYLSAHSCVWCGGCSVMRAQQEDATAAAASAASTAPSPLAPSPSPLDSIPSGMEMPVSAASPELSAMNRQSVAAEKKLCGNCLRSLCHSGAQVG